MFSARVQYTENNHATTGKAIEDFVREWQQQNSTKAAIVFRPDFRVGLQPLNRIPRNVDKFVSQAGALFFIPGTPLAQIPFRARTDRDLSRHFFSCARSLASTSSQELPVSGFLSYSASSPSKIVFSSSVSSSPIPPRSEAPSSSFNFARISRRSVGLSFASSSKISALLTIES